MIEGETRKQNERESPFGSICVGDLSHLWLENGMEHLLTTSRPLFQIIDISMKEEFPTGSVGFRFPVHPVGSSLLSMVSPPSLATQIESV